MRKILSTIDKSLARLENSLIVILLTAMVLMAFLQVLLRNLFETGILWGDIFLRHLVLWVGFIGASLATRQEKHIKIDVLSQVTSQRLVPVIRIIVDMVTIFVCIVLAKAGWDFVAYEIEAKNILFNDIPSWIFQIIIPIGFGLIAFRFLLNLIGEGLKLKDTH